MNGPVRVDYAASGLRHEERERELVEIARLAREVAEQHTPADHQQRSARRCLAGRVSWPLVVALGTVAGVAVGLVIALVLMPEQPDRILVPVPEPAPSMHVDPDDGVQA